MISTVDPADNLYTQKIKKLITQIFVRGGKEKTLYGCAFHYFNVSLPQMDKRRSLRAQRDKLNAYEAKERIESIDLEIQSLTKILEHDHKQRQAFTHSVVEEVMELCLGETVDETQAKCAKALGTIMLTIQGNNRSRAYQHQRVKPLYRTALTTAFFENLCVQQLLDLSFLETESKPKAARATLLFTLVLSTLLLDCGLQHPQTIEILRGEDGKLSPFRPLPEKERKRMLSLNIQCCLAYLEHGLAMFPKADKVRRYAKQMLEASLMSSNGKGDIIKIPQIYSSIILSTKANYDRKELPKTYALIEQLAEKNKVFSDYARAFNKMVGYFPQGYGVTYIANLDDEENAESLEYAIVNKFNPINAIEPDCIVVSQAGRFTARTAKSTVKRGENMFFKGNHQKLRKMPKGRLIEIVSTLRSGFNKNDEEKYFPSFWDPSDFFSMKRNQNLW